MGLLWEDFILEISFTFSWLFPHVACCRKPLSVCYPFTPRGGELDLLTLSVMHLDMVTSTSHCRLFSTAQVGDAVRRRWQRRHGEGGWFLVSFVEEVLIKEAVLTFSRPDILCQLFYSPMRTHVTQVASQQAPCEIHSPHWLLFTIRPLSSSPTPLLFSASNAFPLFMRHPLAFPVQLFSFSLLLLFAWHVEVHGPEVNMVQHSGTKHRSLEVFLSGKVCFQRHF